MPEPIEYVFVSLPTCPCCNATDYLTNRTDKGGDGSKTQHAVCRVCEKKFRIVWECPQDLGERETGSLS